MVPIELKSGGTPPPPSPTDLRHGKKVNPLKVLNRVDTFNKDPQSYEIELVVECSRGYAM